MCGLGGVFEDGRRWMDAAGILDPAAQRRERLKRVAILKRVLTPYRIGVEDYDGRFILTGPTGAAEIVDNLHDLWARAEAFARRPIDPLAADF